MQEDMFPHTVTVYHNPDGEVESITILRGVLLDESPAAEASTRGHSGTGKATLYVPFQVEALDGLTGRPKRYAVPVEFEQAEEKAGLWTFSPGASFFIKGGVVEPDMDRQQIGEKYPSVYEVVSIATRDFGSPDMRHWEAGGK